MEGQGFCHPLVLLYAAVIVGSEKAHFQFFIEGILLQVESRRIDMGYDDSHSLGERTFPQGNQGDVLVFVHPIDSPGLFLIGNLPKAPFLGVAQYFDNSLPFGFGAIEKSFVILGKEETFLPIGFLHLIPG